MMCVFIKCVSSEDFLHYREISCLSIWQRKHYLHIRQLLAQLTLARLKGLLLAGIIRLTLVKLPPLKQKPQFPTLEQPTLA